MEFSSAIQRLLTVLESADQLANDYDKSVNYAAIFDSDTKSKLRKMDILDDVERELRENTQSLKEVVIQNSDFFKAITIILKAMEEESRFAFFRLTIEAIGEANSIEIISNNSRSQKDLEKLSNLLLAGGKLNLDWWKFHDELEGMGAYTILNSLSGILSNKTSALPSLPHEMLEKIAISFQEILDEVTQSSLPQDLKNFVRKNIEELLKAIKQYKVNGSEGIKNVTQIFIADWITIESKIDQEDLRKPALKRIVSRFAVLNAFFGLNIISGISLIPDIESYWLKRFDSYLPVQEIMDIKSIEGPLSLYKSINEASKEFDQHMQKILEGSQEPKALPPGPELGDS